MWSRREVVDGGLQRRNTHRPLQGRQRTLNLSDACDADPILTRSARHHGEAHPSARPACSRSTLVTMNDAFDEQPAQWSGRVVLVGHDRGCNHMTHSYLLGDGVKLTPPQRRQTVEDIYG